MSASTGSSSLRAVDGRAGGARERGDRADVIEVAVGDEDRLDGHAQLLELRLDARGLLAGVDEQRAALARGDPAVLGDRPDREAVRVHQRLRAARLRWLRW